MNSMFQECQSLTNLDLSNFNKENVANMSWMFSGCSELKNLDVSHFKTQKNTNTSSMFDGCSKLTNVPNFNKTSFTDIFCCDWFSKCCGSK